MISFLKPGENKYIGYQLIFTHEFFVISYFKKPFNLIISFKIWFEISNFGLKPGYFMILITSLIGTVYLFVISSISIIGKFIDYKIYGYFSLLPFMTILITLIYYINIKKFSVKLIICNILSLLLFLIFNNIYMYILIKL